MVGFPASILCVTKRTCSFISQVVGVSESSRMEMNSTKYLNYMMMHAWKTVPELGEVTESWNVVRGFLPSSFGAVCI